MGSWFGTCGLTGLPISWNEPVVAMGIYPISKTPNMRPCHCFDWYGPATPLVRATYDDCGSIEMDEKNTRIFNIMKHRYSMHYWEEERYKTEQLPVLDLEKIRDTESNYAIWMAHEYAFDHMAQNIRDDDGSFRYYNRYGIDKNTPPTVNNIVGSLLKYTKSNILDDDRQIEYQLNEELSMRGEHVEFLTYFVMALEDHEDIDLSLEIIADIHRLHHILSKLRIPLEPPTNNGSQDYDLQPYEVRNEVSQTLIEQFKKDCDYDEDEEL